MDQVEVSLAHLVGLLWLSFNIGLIIVAITAHLLCMSKTRSFQRTHNAFHFHCKFLPLIKIPYYSNLLHMIPYICGITMIHDSFYQMMTLTGCGDLKTAKKNRVQKLHSSSSCLAAAILITILCLLIVRSQGARLIWPCARMASHEYA